MTLLILATGGACGTPAPPSASAPSQKAPSQEAPRQTAVGCDETPVRSGALPSWTASANPPDGTRYVLSREGNLVGVLFADPLRAPPLPSGPNNKILWIAREPRNGQELRLTLRPAGGGAPVTVTQAANSSPGEIYPSIVDVPAAGCWTVTAEWDGHRATLALSYLGPTR